MQIGLVIDKIIYHIIHDLKHTRSAAANLHTRIPPSLLPHHSTKALQAGADPFRLCAERHVVPHTTSMCEAVDEADVRCAAGHTNADGP